jgi:hypothetical protein
VLRLRSGSWFSLALFPANGKTYIMHHAERLSVSNLNWEAGYLEPKSDFGFLNSLVLD